MKTAWLLVLVMAVATLYVFDVGGSRRPMGDAYAHLTEQLSRGVSAVRESVPGPPGP